MTWWVLDSVSQLWLFFVLVLGIIALPGMDMAFVLGSTLVDGRRGGLAALAGIVAGGAVHTAMAALGVALALQLVPGLFQGMLIVGALYLAWIGLSLMRGASALGDVQEAPRRSAAATFWRGWMTCLLNPKAYLFMAAVYPQFARPQYGPMAVQAVAMGLIIAVTQFALYGGLVLGAARARNLLRHSGGLQVRAGQAVGLLLVAGALALLWQARAPLSVTAP